MDYTIRKATTEDLADIMRLLDEGRAIMRANGNWNQWPEGYPSEATIRGDISSGNSYIILDNKGHAVATFAFIIGPDPTYSVIYDGAWCNKDAIYGTIHRLASEPDAHGIGDACFSWCKKQVDNLRADTHRDNTIMQHVLLSQGFQYRGIIHIANGDERLAYEYLPNPYLPPPSCPS